MDVHVLVRLVMFIMYVQTDCTYLKLVFLCCDWLNHANTYNIPVLGTADSLGHCHGNNDLDA